MSKSVKITTTSCYKECPSIKMRLKTTSINDKNRNSQSPYYYVTYKIGINCCMILTDKSLAVFTSGFQLVIHLFAIILVIFGVPTIFSRLVWQRPFVLSGFMAGQWFTLAIPKTLRMHWTRSIVRPLEFEYLLLILGRTSILSKH